MIGHSVEVIPRRMRDGRLQFHAVCECGEIGYGKPIAWTASGMAAAWIGAHHESFKSNRFPNLTREIVVACSKAKTEYEAGRLTCAAIYFDAARRYRDSLLIALRSEPPTEVESTALMMPGLLREMLTGEEVEAPAPVAPPGTASAPMGERLN